MFNMQTASAAGTVFLMIAATCGAATRQTPPADQTVEALAEERRERDATIWAAERQAQRYETYFVELWDQLRANDHGLDILLAHAPQRLTIPNLAAGESPGEGIESWHTGRGGVTMRIEEFGELLLDLQQQGYRIEQSEWHHSQFKPGMDAPPQSTVGFVIDARNAVDETRVQIKGQLQVFWRAADDDDRRIQPESMAVRDIAVVGRPGAPLFQQAFQTMQNHVSPSDDVLVHDLNGDGYSDIIYPSSNLLLINEGGFAFRSESLCEHPTTLVYESVLADFTNDGYVDLLVAGVSPVRVTSETRMRLWLYEGDEGGRFTQPSRRVGPRDVTYERPDCFAVGDIDRDGDLDVWMTQYLTPYVRGNFPDPYYDANDGLPAYLLINDGAGDFTDGTEGSGLAAKRWRRTFRSSFVDLDEDSDLDLVVVSDFAGTDLYENDGSGHFRDVTLEWLDEPASFGMSHTFADFNADGRTDLYVTGMGSTTARRLESLGLGRDDLPDFQDARMRIAYGNRMYLAQDDGSFRQPTYMDDVARSGWAWGCASPDFNLDGRPDIYVTNGNQSGKSAQDYCTTFWCHDIYTGSAPDEATEQLFSLDLSALSAGEISWNGFEHNHLFMNTGDGFTNVSYLMGVALEEDCRAAVADDFDMDGRPDLLVVAFDRSRQYPRRSIRVFRNTYSGDGNWIGLRLRGMPGVSPIGARVTVRYDGGVQTDSVVTGDSAKCHHAWLVHFGLGNAAAVQSVEIAWPDGQTQTIDAPAINAYHEITPPVGQ